MKFAVNIKKVLFLLFENVDILNALKLVNKS